MGRRLLVCHHEAGHAFARWYFGHGTDRVIVQTVEAFRAGRRLRNGRSGLVHIEGLTEGYDIIGWPFGRLQVSGGPAAQAECDRIRAHSRDVGLISCYAGFHAEAAYRRIDPAQAMFNGGLDDMAHARMVLDAWLLTGAERDAVATAAEARTRALVRSSAGRAATGAIARCLASRGRLSGAQVAALCRAAYGGRECRFGAWMNQWPPTLKQLREGHVPERQARAAAGGR